MMKTVREYEERKLQNWYDAIDKLDGNKRKIYDIIRKHPLIMMWQICKRMSISLSYLKDDFEDLKDIGLIMSKKNEDKLNSMSVLKITTANYFQGKKYSKIVLYNRKIDELQMEIDEIKNKIERIS